jgi:hypothetical protein
MEAELITQKTQILRFTLILIALAISRLAAARDETKIEIEPGPTTMTAAERAIEADPDNGIRDGVILLDETDRDEASNNTNTVTYHVRAKILTAEGRGLADVVTPFNQDRSKLKRWWGHTILPDGTVLELLQDELEEQTIARTNWSDYSVLKGTLPGVVPGSVIDFGYRVRVDGFIPPPPIPLQRSWPMVSFRYRWVPWGGYTAAYTITNQDKVAVDVRRTKKAVLVEAHDAAPVIDEPLGPPPSAARAMLHLYYSDTSGSVENYWRDKGKDFERLTKRFIGSAGAGRKLLEETGIQQRDDLQDSHGNGTGGLRGHAAAATARPRQT